MRSLNDPWTLGGHTLPNRLVLAPLAGIGNWFVRLQAKRYGAGLAVSEMVSSFGLKYGDERTHREFLRIHPEEHPIAIQLFGHDPEVMKEAAAIVAEKGADLIDINMGCPVRKVCKTGAGASLLDDPRKAVALANAAREGSGLPVTVKVRSGNRPGERTGFDLAVRLTEEAGVAGIGFHPRHASQQHKGTPDYALAAELVQRLGETPVIISGGLADEDSTLRAFNETGAAAAMLARGSLGNPWRFARLLGTYGGEPSPRRGRDRASLGDRQGRGPPRDRARRPLPAQVLPLVRRDAGPLEAAGARAPHGPHHGRRKGFPGPPRSPSCSGLERSGTGKECLLHSRVPFTPNKG